MVNKIKALLRNTGLYRKYWTNKEKRYIISSVINRSYLSDEKDKDAVALKMIRVNQQTEIDYSEFIQFHCWEKTDDEISGFIGNLTRRRITAPMNPKKEILADKWQTYELYREFFHRDVLRTDYENENDLRVFLQKHRSFIVKPLSLNRGQGIRVVDGTGRSADELISDLKEQYPGECLLEELVIQCDEMAAFHPKSVNTIRLTTVPEDGEIRVLFPCIRMGRGEAVVDNAGAGGIFGALDEEGRAFGATDKMGFRYTVHPDTNVPIVGFSVPRWSELMELVVKIAKICPENRYCAWDLR